ITKVIPELDRGDSSALVALRLVLLLNFTIYPDGTKNQDINYHILLFQLLPSEVVQFMQEDVRRYISIYNFFNLASIIMPLATYTVELIRESRGDISPNQLKQLTIAIAFTVLVLWIERWNQLEQWNFWPISLFSFITSVLLVIVIQNMLIVFISGVFDKVKSDGRLAVLKYQAKLIADYETLEKPFEGSSSGDAKEWDITELDSSSSDHKGLISGKTSNGSIDDRNIQDKKVFFKDNIRRSSSIDDGLSTVASLHAYEISSINEDVNSIHDEILTLKDSVKSVKGSIDNRSNSLEGKLVEMIDLLNKLTTANNLNSSGDISSGTGNI
ncbi:4976_t:CDS:2, partial [Funneliformis mosseae]